MELELKDLLRDLKALSKQVQIFISATEKQLDEEGEEGETERPGGQELNVETAKIKDLLASETMSDASLVRRMTRDLDTLLARRTQLASHLTNARLSRKRIRLSEALHQSTAQPRWVGPEAGHQRPLTSHQILAPLPGTAVPNVNSVSVFMSMTTCNRFWHAALTLLTLINTALPEGVRRVVYVLDDHSDDEYAEVKMSLLNDLKRRGLIQKLEVNESRMGFIKARERVVDCFFESGCSHWFHTDDDIVLSPDCVWRPIHDMDTWIGPSLNFVFVNSWCKLQAHNLQGSPMAIVPYAGGACFVISRSAMEKIGNIYKGLQVQSEETNKIFWSSLHRFGLPTVTNSVQPYGCQHVGNVESVIYGHTPDWESLFAVNRNDGSYVQVDGFDFDIMREKIRKDELHLLLTEKNGSSNRIFHNTLNQDILAKALEVVGKQAKK